MDLEYSASESEPEDDLSESGISSCGDQEDAKNSKDQTIECAGTERVSEVKCDPICKNLA